MSERLELRFVEDDCPPAGAADERFVRVPRQRNETKGADEGVPLQLTVEGSGFLVLEGTLGEITGHFLARSVELEVDRSGQLMNQHGLSLCGYEPEGFPSRSQTDVGPLTLESICGEESPCLVVTLKANLDVVAEERDSWEIERPESTSNAVFVTSVELPGGTPVSARVCFRKVTPLNWAYHLIVDGRHLVGEAKGENVEIAGGRLDFDSCGNLIEQRGHSIDVGSTERGESGRVCLDFSGSRQHAAPTSIQREAGGSESLRGVERLEIDTRGAVVARSASGTRRSVGRLAVAGLRGETELASVRSGLWYVDSAEDGISVGWAGTEGMGHLARAPTDTGEFETVEEV